METKEKIRIAFIRGNSLNEWEGGLWNHLGDDFSVTGVCSKKNLYSVKGLLYPIIRLATSTDNKFRSFLSTYILGKFFCMKGLKDLLKDFDIAHTAEISNYYTFQAVRAKKTNSSLKVVCTVWDNSMDRFEHTYGRFHIKPPFWWKKRIKRIIREVIDGVDLFLPVSKRSQEFLRSYGVPDNKMRVLMPAVTNASFSHHATLLEQLGLASGQFYIATQRMVKEKGVSDILEAWAQFCAQTHNKKKLVIIGKGPEEQAYRGQATKLGILDRVIFIPALSNEEVRFLASQARALLLASLATPIWEEQFGYVLAESIIAGTPVISTKTGAIPEVVGSAGILVHPSSPDEILEALKQMENDNVYQKLSLACQKEAGKFSQDRFKKELLTYYQSLL